MFRLAIIFAVSWVAVLATVSEKDFFTKCGKLLLNPATKHCCKIPMQVPTAEDEVAMKECMVLPGKPNSCERDICIANKKGFTVSNGKIDKAKAAAVIEKDLEASPEVVAAVKEKCINGDVSMYGPADACDVMRFGLCGHLQLLAHCPNWDTTGPCEGMKDEAAECAKLYP